MHEHVSVYLCIHSYEFLAIQLHLASEVLSIQIQKCIMAGNLAAYAKCSAESI